MADTPFRRKLESVQLRTGPAAPKRTIDVHDRGRVVVTERTDQEGDHQDVHVYPKAVALKASLNQEAS